MAEQQQGQGQGSPEGGQGGGLPEGGQQQQGQGSPEGGQQQEPDGSSVVIARLNSEAKTWREKFEGAQSRLQEIEQGQMSDLEKTQTALAQAESRATEAEATLQKIRLSQAAAGAASKAHAVDPSLVANLLDPSRIEFDQAGQPTNLDSLVGEIAKAHPVLFGTGNGSADQGARGGSSAPTSDMNELIRRGAGRAQG